MGHKAKLVDPDWFCYPSSTGKTWFIQRFGASSDDRDIAVTDHEHAAIIIHLHNSRDELVAALEAAMPIVRAAAPSTGPGAAGRGIAIAAVYEQIVTALALSNTNSTKEEQK